MDIVLFSADRKAISTKIQKAFKGLCAGGTMSALTTYEELKSRLEQPETQTTVVLLLINNRDELEQILLLEERLGKYQIVLMLPDRDPETLSLAYKLRPRFISYHDKGYAEVKAVVKNICERNLQIFFPAQASLCINT